jgi:hypothetical protein
LRSARLKKKLVEKIFLKEIFSKEYSRKKIFLNGIFSKEIFSKEIFNKYVKSMKTQRPGICVKHFLSFPQKNLSPEKIEIYIKIHAMSVRPSFFLTPFPRTNLRAKYIYGFLLKWRRYSDHFKVSW